VRSLFDQTQQEDVRYHVTVSVTLRKNGIDESFVVLRLEASETGNRNHARVRFEEWRQVIGRQRRSDQALCVSVSLTEEVFIE